MSNLKQTFIVFFTVLAFCHPSLAVIDFFDPEIEQDDLQSLYRKFPDLVVPEDDLQMDLIAASKQDRTHEDLLISGFMMFEPEAFRIPQLTKHYKNYSSEIYKAAKKVAALHHKQDGFIFLGRSPLWIMHAAKLILLQQDKSSSNFFPVNFSGTPDIEFIRPDQLNKNYKNIVTPDRLAFFENYLDQLGLNKMHKKLYVVDVVARGGSLNSFLRLLRHYYRVHLSEQLPDIHVIAINFIDHHPHAIENVWTANLAESNKLVYSPSLENRRKGFTPLQVDVVPLGVLNEVSLGLDDNIFQYQFSSGVEFPANRWSMKYSEYLQGQGEMFQEIQVVFLRKMQLLMETESAFIKKDLVSGAQTISCSVCGSTEKQLKCGKCRSVIYCSPECQKADWKKHKLVCKKPIEVEKKLD